MRPIDHAGGWTRYPPIHLYSSNTILYNYGQYSILILLWVRGRCLHIFLPFSLNLWQIQLAAQMMLLATSLHACNPSRSPDDATCHEPACLQSQPQPRWCYLPPACMLAIPAYDTTRMAGTSSIFQLGLCHYASRGVSWEWFRKALPPGKTIWNFLIFSIICSRSEAIFSQNVAREGR